MLVQAGPQVVVEPQVIEQPVQDVVEPPEPPPVDPATLPYQNPAAETTTTYQATVVANRFATLLVATRDKNAEAAAAALDNLKNDAKLNLDVLILLATKSVSAGSATDPSGQAKVMSVLEPDLVAKLAKGFLDAFSDGADLTTLSNGQVDAIKRALDSQEAKPAVAELAENADHALLIGTLRKGHFVNVAPAQIAADDVELTAKKTTDESVTYPVLEKPAKEVVSFLVNVVGLAENAVKGGTQDKTFKPGSIGAKLAADLLKKGEPLPQVLKDANAATALRNALDVNCDAFFRFVFDTKKAIAAVSPLLKPEMEQLAAKIRALIVETTGCVAFAGKLDLSAIPGKLADKLMAFIRNDVALEQMAKLFSVAEPTFEVGKRRADAELAAASYKKGDEAAKAKDASNALTAVNYLKGDASYAEFSSPQAHAIYSALFGTTESFAPDEGIFNKDSMHVGCLGEIFTCVLGNPAGKDAAAKLGEILERFDTGVYDKALTKYIIKLANEKRLAHGADEIEKLCDRLKATKEFRQELRDKWADLTERVAKFSKGDNDAIVKLCREIAEKVLDLIYNSCELAVNNVTEHEDKDRIEETTLQTRTVGKKTETYEYKEWEARIWSLPEVISRVVDSATSGFFDKVFLAKNIGATKAKRVMDQIENGKDYPQGHKATAA